MQSKQDTVKWDSCIRRCQISNYIRTQWNGILHQMTLDGTIILRRSRFIVTLENILRQHKVDGKIILGHCRLHSYIITIKLGHSRWDNNITTQQTGCLLHQDTVNGTILLGHSRLGVTIGHCRQEIYETADLIVMLGHTRQDTVYRDTVDKTVTIGHNRQNSRPDNYVRTHQTGQLTLLHGRPDGQIGTQQLKKNYVKTQQMGKLYQDKSQLMKQQT